jgi:hypothetical protein
MKKILVLLLCVPVFGSALLFQGCGKNNKSLAQQYAIQLNIGPEGCIIMNGGPIQMSGTKTFEINEGVSLYFEFIPNWGCEVDVLRIDGVPEYVSSGYPFYPLPDIHDDHTIDVTFRKNVYGLITSSEAWVRDSVCTRNPDGSWLCQATNRSESIRFWRPGNRYKVFATGGVVSEGFWSMNGNDQSGKMGPVSDENPAVITLDGPIEHIVGTSWRIQEITQTKLKVILTSHDASVNAMNYRFVFTPAVL